MKSTASRHTPVPEDSCDPCTAQEVVDMLVGLPVMYLVHRTGPTSFVVREDGDDIKKKVSIGARPSCSWWACTWGALHISVKLLVPRAAALHH